jgi:predicted transcriptional regulator
MAHILSVGEGGAKKTHIMYQCNLSYRQICAYLDFLVDMGFLEFITLKTENNDDSVLFEITNKGKDFIKAYQNLKTLLTK